LTSGFATFETEFKRKVLPRNACGEIVRAAKRLAIIAFAGKKATEWGITGWQLDESAHAAMDCFNMWLRGRETEGSSDAEQAFGQVKAFFEAHGASRFPMLRASNGTDQSNALVDTALIHNRAGYRRITRSGEVEFLVFSETFKSQVCAGHDYRAVARDLKQRGFLNRDEPHLTLKVNLPEIGMARVFCILGSILR
jgi:putative DNA primase/helicase